MGTFPLSTLPVELPYAAEDGVVDRWGPVSDDDRDMITGLREVRGDWITTGSVAFGFEDESIVFTDHIFEYYNLVVTRPKILPMKISLDMVSAKMGLI